MWWFRTLAARLRGVFAGNAADRELDREIEDHLRLLAERFMLQGMAAEDAEYAARRQFGGVTQLREYHREARGLSFVEHFVRDLSLSVRLLRKRTGFSLTAITILALGIGATTAIYSVAKAVVFASLPFPNPDRLVELFQGWNDGRHSNYKRVVYKKLNSTATLIQRTTMEAPQQTYVLPDLCTQQVSELN